MGSEVLVVEADLLFLSQYYCQKIMDIQKGCLSFELASPWAHDVGDRMGSVAKARGRVQSNIDKDHTRDQLT